jgi:hypothetical protein
MPQKSKMSKAALKKRTASSTSFISNKLTNYGVSKQDEYYDIDDDLLSGFKTDDECEEEVEVEVDEQITEETVAELTSKVTQWIDPGHNCGVRGAGTSESTFYRNLSKQKKTSEAGKESKSIKYWLVPTSSSSLPSTSSSTGTSTESNSTAATATALDGTLNDDTNEDLDIDFSIFGILDENNIFGEILESEDKNEVKAKPKYTAAEAKKNLLGRLKHT